MNKVFKVNIRATGDFHTSAVSKGSQVSALVIRIEGKKYAKLAGTSLKGLMRFELERLWFSKFSGSKGCDITKKGQFSSEIRNNCGDCPICSIFGYPNMEGGNEYKATNLRVLDFIGKIDETLVRERNYINRETGETNLYSMEVIPKGTVLTGYIIVSDYSDEYLRYLNVSLKSALQYGLGGSRTSGFGGFELVGKVEEAKDFVKVPDIKIIANNDKDKIKEVSGWKIISGRLVADSALHLGTGKITGTFHPTQHYIPGQALRGMFGYYINKMGGNAELYKDLSMEANIEEESNDVGAIFRNAYPEGGIYFSGDEMYCKRCKELIPYPEGNNLVQECAECGHEGKPRKGLNGVKTYISTKNPYSRHDCDPKNKLSPYNLELIKEGQGFDFCCLVRLPDEKVAGFIRNLSEAGVYAGVGGFKGKGYGSIRFEAIKVEDASAYISARASKLKSVSQDGWLKMVVNSLLILPSKDKGGKKSNIQKNEISLDFNKIGWAFRHSKRVLNVDDRGYSLNVKDVKVKSLSESIVGHWSLKKGNLIESSQYAVAPGSSAEIKINSQDMERAAIFELFGIGHRISSGHGNFYFKEVKAK